MNGHYLGFAEHKQFDNDERFLGSDIILASSCWCNFALVLKPGNLISVRGIPFEKPIILKLEDEITQIQCCPDELIVITVKGELLKHNGEQWTKISSPYKVDKIAYDSQKNYVIISDGNIYDFKSNFSEIIIPEYVTDITGGAEHFLALTKESNVYSRGSSLRGQLGNAGLSEINVPTKIEALSGLGVKQISCGLWHNAVITKDGDAYTWGWNHDGQLGLTDNNEDSKISVLATPHPIDISIGLKYITCGGRHTVAIADDGSVWGCGLSKFGQLGKRNQDKLEKLTLIPWQCSINKIYAGGWNSIFLYN